MIFTRSLRLFVKARRSRRGQPERQLVAVTGSHLPAHGVQPGSRDRERAAGRDSHLDREPEALDHDPSTGPRPSPSSSSSSLALGRAGGLLVAGPDERHRRDRRRRQRRRCRPAGVTDARRQRRRRRESTVDPRVIDVLLTIDVLRAPAGHGSRRTRRCRSRSRHRRANTSSLVPDREQELLSVLVFVNVDVAVVVGRDDRIAGIEEQPAPVVGEVVLEVHVSAC